MLAIRTLQKTDLETIGDYSILFNLHHYRLWSETLGEPFDEAHWLNVQEHNEAKQKWMEELEETIDQPEKQVFLLHDGQRIAGCLYVGIRLDHHLYEPAGFVHWIYVHPDFRGRNYAKRMMEEGEKWFRDNGIKLQQVFVTANNPHAVRLYESFGYRIADYRMMKKGK